MILELGEGVGTISVREILEIGVVALLIGANLVKPMLGVGAITILELGEGVGTI